MRKDIHEANRRSWNAATVAHNSHKRDQARFLREGGSTLFQEELELLGDVRGKALAHLQCNSGQDSLSLASLGAAVTGVDISDEAIEFARALSEGSGIEARFVRADLYDWFDQASAEAPAYDLVLASYGTLVWLSDLPAWGRGVASILRPGGRVVVIEFHPGALAFDEELRLAYPAMGAGDPVENPEGVGDYVAASGEGLTPSGRQDGVENFQNPHRCHEFPWTISDLVTAVMGAGLELETLREYPHANGCRLFANMRELGGQRYGMPRGRPAIPLMVGLAARKRG